jgi:hypothetical protein
MTGDPAGSTLRKLAVRRVAGKPFVVTEYGHPSPNGYGAEGAMLAAIYGGFQDWDALLRCAYAAGQTYGNGPFTQFPFSRHPAKMATLPQAALMFRRGDVPAGKITRKSFRPLSAATAFARLEAGQVATGADALGANRLTALRQQTGVALTDDPQSVKLRPSNSAAPTKTRNVARFAAQPVPATGPGSPAADDGNGKTARLAWTTRCPMRSNCGVKVFCGRSRRFPCVLGLGGSAGNQWQQ